MTPRRHIVARLRAGRALALVLLLLGGCGPRTPPAPTAQNPSPMVETTRAHERLTADDIAGARHSVTGVLAVPVHVFAPATVRDARRLLVHFHGAPFIGEHAVARSGGTVLANVQLGAGSRAYETPFLDATVLPALIAAVERVAGVDGFDTLVLSGFSAGYGAIRAILRDSVNAARVDGVVLLDGLHTAYVPPGVPLAAGGALDTALLAPFERFARGAVAGRATFVLTHSEIFSGTFASTTETADWLLDRLGMTRTAVLAWGPLGMQQLGAACAGRFVVQRFAGNTAPDHIDHLHALYHFLALHDRINADGCPG